MRNRYVRRLAAAMTISSLALAGGLVSGTSAQELVPGAVDVAPQIQVITPTVSPPGTLAYYKVTVTQGLVGTAGMLTVTLPAGSALDAALSDSSCTASSNVVSCPFGVTERTFALTATTPGAGTHQIAAVVAASSDPLGLEYTPNNTATAQITVQQPATTGSVSGVVKRGQSLSLNLADGRSFNLSVPTTSSRGEEGVIVEIRAQAGTGFVCPSSPTGTCGDGFWVLFDNTHPPYVWTDATNPLVNLQSFGTTDPCFGIGGTCTGIDFSKDPALPFQPVPSCVGQNGANPGNGQALPGSPCINQKYKGSNNKLFFDVRSTSVDPIYLPIGKLG